MVHKTVGLTDRSVFDAVGVHQQKISGKKSLRVSLLANCERLIAEVTFRPVKTRVVTPLHELAPWCSRAEGCRR